MLFFYAYCIFYLGSERPVFLSGEDTGSRQTEANVCRQMSKMNDFFQLT